MQSDGGGAVKAKESQRAAESRGLAQGLEWLVPFRKESGCRRMACGGCCHNNFQLERPMRGNIGRSTIAALTEENQARCC